MRETTSSRSRRSEIHRYFPEWADRPAREGAPWEADRNSYSAGGYAEEFGYGSQPGLPSPARQLDGDPESSAQWRVQIGIVHPGYPECPKPLNREEVETRPALTSDAFCAERGLHEGRGYIAAAPQFVAKPAPVLTVLQVGKGNRQHGGFLRQLICLWKIYDVHHPKLWRYRRGS